MFARCPFATVSFNIIVPLRMLVLLSFYSIILWYAFEIDVLFLFRGSAVVSSISKNCFEPTGTTMTPVPASLTTSSKWCFWCELAICALPFVFCGTVRCCSRLIVVVVLCSWV